MPAKLDRCVKEVVKRKVSTYKKTNGNAPSADKKSKFESAAFAICTKALEEG